MFLVKRNAGQTFKDTVLGDLKESPLLGESSRVTFSRMAKYSSVTVLHIFRTTGKAIEDKVCLHQS